MLDIFPLPLQIYLPSFSTLPWTFWLLVWFSKWEAQVDDWSGVQEGSFLAGSLRSVASLHQRPKIFIKHHSPTAILSGSLFPLVPRVVTVHPLLAYPWGWHHLGFFLTIFFFLNNSAHIFGKSLYAVTPFEGAVSCQNLDSSVLKISYLKKWNEK